MYDNKTVLIIDLIIAGLLTVVSFAVGATNWGEPYNELYFAVSFICGVLSRFIAEKVENFNKK